MANDTTKNLAVGIGAVAVIGGLLAIFSGKPKPSLGPVGGAVSPPRIRKNCNCGR